MINWITWTLEYNTSIKHTFEHIYILSNHSYDIEPLILLTLWYVFTFCVCTKRISKIYNESFKSKPNKAKNYSILTLSYSIHINPITGVKPHIYIWNDLKHNPNCTQKVVLSLHCDQYWWVLVIWAISNVVCSLQKFFKN